MEVEYQFWTSFWKLIGLVFVISLIATFSYMSNSNHQWYSSWNKCVEAGGQPIEESHVGRNDSSLTCIRK